MGSMVAPATCAECRRVELYTLLCRNCGLTYCEECSAQLHYICPVCKAKIGSRGITGLDFPKRQL